MTESGENTVKWVLKASEKYLAGKGVDNALLVCEILLSRLLQCKRLELSLSYELVLNPAQLAAMRRGIMRAGKGEPVQYIVGQAEFMGHLFNVDKRVLIPRPETEVLVDAVLKCDDLWNESDDKTSVVDIGTGSGCILLSLAYERKNAVYLGIDISSEAIDVARENAGILGLGERVNLVSGELSDFVEPESVDIIVSNPPYITTSDCEKLPVNVRDYEPRIALDGGSNGLSVINMVVQDAGFVLRTGGYLFLEMGETQADKVTAIFKENGFSDVKVIQDLTQRDRIVCGCLPPL